MLSEDTYDIERYVSDARGACEEAEYALDSIGRECRDISKDIEKILKNTEVVEEVEENSDGTLKVTARKKPATKKQ